MWKKRLRAILARRKELMAQAESENRALTAEESEELKKLAAEAKEIQAQMDLDEEFQSLDSSLNSGGGRQSSPDAPGGAQAAGGDVDEMGGFASAGEFFQAVQNAAGGNVDDRLVLEASSSMTNDGERGYEIPVGIRNNVISVLEEDTGDLLSRVESEPTNAQAVKIPKDVDAPWMSQGLVAHWENAGDEIPSSGLNATNSKTVEMNPLSILVKVDDDLLEDAPRLANRLLSKAPELLRWTVNEVIRNGDGVGKPRGYRESESMITVKKEKDQPAGSLVAANIFAMLRHLSPAARKRAIWLINPDLEEELAMLKDDAGNLIFSSRNQSMTTETDGILKGIPVVWDEHAEEIGTAGDIQLIVPEGYYFGYRDKVAKFAQSMHVYFDQAKTAFRWRWRVGGDTFLSEPYDSAKSKSKRTHFVQLDDRG